MLQGRMSRVRFSMSSVDFSIILILLLSVQSASSRSSTKNLLGGKGRPARKADILIAIFDLTACKNEVPSNSHKPMRLYGLLQIF
jgi:hypothetical protein